MTESSNPTIDRIRTAAVLVDSGADIEWRRSHVDGSAAHILVNQNVTPCLPRPALEPVHGAIVEPDLGQSNGIRDDQVGGDGGSPRTVRSRSHVCHPRVSCVKANRLRKLTGCLPHPAAYAAGSPCYSFGSW